MGLPGVLWLGGVPVETSLISFAHCFRRMPPDGSGLRPCSLGLWLSPSQLGRGFCHLASKWGFS